MGKFHLTFLDHQGAEFTGINWRITQSIDDVRDSADVIKMPVGDHYGANFMFTFLEIFDIW